MTGQRLSALDATFLELEDADPSAHMHIGGVMIFSGSAPTQAELLERLEARLPALPRLRQQLSVVREGALHRPNWVAATHFDPATHVRRAGLPVPAGDAELLAWAGDYFSVRLDRRRPLWEAVVIDNLSDDRWALVSKMHHCLADGVGSLDALRLWADGAEALPARPPRGSDEPSVMDAVRTALGLGLHPARTLRRSAAIAELAIREELRGAPHTSLNEAIGTRRRLAEVDADLDGMKAIKRALGGRVNDVALAAVTAGLRALLLERGDPLPHAGLRAMVP
ncbi:MAG: diacylglycerol O-acyltransferase / wax synthase, partial [Solirubrobacteraceae bacterium]|nr:diacylglycerol O-acyltransferase / wax synthase [Solirubrobacteraceae bacterium]